MDTSRYCQVAGDVSVDTIPGYAIDILFSTLNYCFTEPWKPYMKHWRLCYLLMRHQRPSQKSSCYIT